MNAAIKQAAILTLAILLIGCGSSDDEVRRLVREELANSSTRSFITDAQVIGPYSPAVRAGEYLFVSGQIGLTPDAGEMIGEDIERQTRQSLDNLMSILRKAGYDSSHVVQCTIYLKDINDFPKMNLLYGGYFAEGAYPARATVEVSNLPRKAKVEIAAVAYKTR
jgi:2-iminobutanoate/2-iminopropanoate deaminase